jgi:hypothetical protein
MTTPTNDQRADWAQEALETFVKACGDHPSVLTADPMSAITDLMVDLCHLAHRNGEFSIHTLLFSVEENYAEEIGEELQELEADLEELDETEEDDDADEN